MSSLGPSNAPTAPETVISCDFQMTLVVLCDCFPFPANSRNSCLLNPSGFWGFHRFGGVVPSIGMAHHRPPHGVAIVVTDFTESVLADVESWSARACLGVLLFRPR